MLTSTINFYVLAALLKAAHVFPLAGFFSAFVVFHFNKMESDGSQPSLRSRLFKLLSFPFYIVAAAFILTAVISLFEFGFAVTPSFFDIAFFAGTSIVGVASALVLLRSGVQVFEKTKAKLTKTSELERNKKTDIREISKFLPRDKQRFDPLKFIDFKKGFFLGLDEQDKPIYVKKGDWETCHTMLTGRTRSGKGVSTQIIGAQSILCGEFFVALDPKIDAWMPHIFKQVCDKAGKPYHFLDLRQSAPPQIDLFAGCDAGMIENMLIGAFGLTERGTDADHYRLGDRKAARQMARWLVENPGKTVRDVLAEFAESWKETAKGFSSALEEMAELPAVNRTDGQGIDVDAMAASGGCLYVVGDMQNTRIVRMQRMILMRLMLLAKERDTINQTPRIIRVLADEFRVHISRPFIISLGASAGWRLLSILAFQSFGDLEDVPADLSPKLVAKSAVENCAIQLSYRIKDGETAEILAAGTGDILVDDETKTVEKNLALSETVDRKRSLRQAERFFIDKNMITSLPVPDPDKKTIGCGVLLGVSPLAQFCFTSPIIVERTNAAITPTVPLQLESWSSRSVADSALDVSANPIKTTAPAFDELPPIKSNPFPSADLSPADLAGQEQADAALLDAPDDSAHPFD